MAKIKRKRVKVDPDVMEKSYSALLTHMCAEQDLCSDKCPMLLYCDAVENKRGYDCGEFERWKLVDLKGAVGILGGKVFFQYAGKTVEMSAEGEFMEVRI